MLGGGGIFGASLEESRLERRLRCWESVIQPGLIETQCPVCRGSTIRYHNTNGNTFQQMHIVPQRAGGSDQSWNLLPGCGCNQNMRYMNLLDWMGTRGNKHQLMKTVCLAKYKSLVPPSRRSRSDARQLVEWLRETYAPERLDEYAEWLLLLDNDLAGIQSEDGLTTVPSPSPSPPQPPLQQHQQQQERRVSPYFGKPHLWNAHRRYAQCHFRKKSQLLTHVKKNTTLR